MSGSSQQGGDRSHQGVLVVSEASQGAVGGDSRDAEQALGWGRAVQIPASLHSHWGMAGKLLTPMSLSVLLSSVGG